MLIFLEGLPGAGKSTNSGLLYRQFERSGKSTRWIHEMLRLHPVLFFNEACLSKEEYEQWCNKYDIARGIDKIAQKRDNYVGIDLLEVEWHYQELFSKEAFQALKQKDVWNFSLCDYKKVALEKWRAFAKEAAKQPEKVFILDSCIFQYQVFSFQLVDAPQEELFAFVGELWDIVGSLNPKLVYLYRESVENQIEHLKKVRGEIFFRLMWERDRHNPYYKDKPYGEEAYHQFLREYDQIVRELFKDTPCPKLSLEVTRGDWTQYQDSLLKFCNLEYHPEPHSTFPLGEFRNKDLDLSLKIFGEPISGYKLVDPNGVSRRLYPRSDKEWYIEDYPVNLILNDKNKNQIIIGGENLTNRWTESNLVFDRF
ncbi:hypothetical protein PASE110613_00030 [Paenibacillus sediminis]|uniref:Thymidylate kinase n=1 Tax=Paenibacillus sediminis TaxID=664909 RepID=A0ABS4H0J4_9BACL|nr:hypothetical protein [Paenibacillus sediminis]MBP1936034.1 hypothetical protein [Paenibacillus sediminis]